MVPPSKRKRNNPRLPLIITPQNEDVDTDQRRYRQFEEPTKQMRNSIIDGFVREIIASKIANGKPERGLVKRQVDRCNQTCPNVTLSKITPSSCPTTATSEPTSQCFNRCSYQMCKVDRSLLPEVCQRDDCCPRGLVHRICQNEWSQLKLDGTEVDVLMCYSCIIKENEGVPTNESLTNATSEPNETVTPTTNHLSRKKGGRLKGSTKAEKRSQSIAVIDATNYVVKKYAAAKVYAQTNNKSRVEVGR